MSASSPMSLISHLTRINLISGKGGVGRTAIAATLARANAESGKRTLLAEIEDDSGWDSPLARNFGHRQFEVEPALIEKNLYAVRLSAQAGQEQFLNSFLKVSALTNLVLGNQGVKWFLEGAPAFREMGFFNHLLVQLKKREFETIILDLPATGHLVGLARLPNILLKMIPFGPIAERLKEGQKYFYDQAQTAAWIVTLPQTLPISEAIELKDALAVEAVPVGGFILNRAPLDPFNSNDEVLLNHLGPATQQFAVELERIRRLREARERLAHEKLEVWIAPEVFHPIEDPEFVSRIQNSRGSQ